MIIHDGKLHFSDKDTFGINTVLNGIIAEAIKQFKNTLQDRDDRGKVYGIPISMFTVDGDYDLARDNWFTVLDKIIYAFEHGDADITDGRGRVDEGRQLFIKHYDELWW